MRVLFAADVPPNPDSGAAGTEFQTIRALRRLGHEVDEIWNDDLPHRIRHGNLHSLIELPRGYVKAIEVRSREHSYDVLHVNQSHSFLAAKIHERKKRSGVFVCRSHGFEPRAEKVLAFWRKKYGISCGGNWLRQALQKSMQQLLQRHHKLITRYADGMIVSCQEDRGFIIHHYGMAADRVACIPQAPPQSFLDTPGYHLNEERFKKILFVGADGFWKGPQVAMEAIHQLLDQEQDAQLTWVSNIESHEAIAARLSPAARLRTTLLPWQSQENLRRIYDNHGIFLFPSFFEGFGKVFLEAMSRGLVVVATDTGGMRDLIHHGVDGYLVPLGDSNAIVNAVQSVWASLSTAQALSRAGIRAAGCYTWDRVALETESFYSYLLERRSR